MEEEEEGTPERHTTEGADIKSLKRVLSPTATDERDAKKFNMGCQDEPEFNFDEVDSEMKAARKKTNANTVRKRYGRR